VGVVLLLMVLVAATTSTWQTKLHPTLFVIAAAAVLGSC
jgi:hypothetical protein